VTWNVLGLRNPGDHSNQAMYPLLDKRDQLVLEELDGNRADVVASGPVGVFERVDGGLRQVAKVPHAEVTLTAGRVAVIARAVKERDVLYGIGTVMEAAVFPVEALVGTALERVEGRFRRSRKPQTVAAGHVRLPWLQDVMVQLARPADQPLARLWMNVSDGTSDPRRSLLVQCKVGKNTDVVAVAEAIVGSCAAYRLDRWPPTADLQAEWEAMTQPHFEGVSADRESVISLPSSYAAHPRTSMPPV